MNELVLRGLTGAPALLAPVFVVGGWLSSADERLRGRVGEAEPEVAIASVAEDAYCTPELKKIVRRVATACGLVGASGRGCQPMQAKQVAQLTDDEFNGLFKPLSERARILQFDADQVDLDEPGRRAVEGAWAEQGGVYLDVKIECGFDRATGELLVADVIDSDSGRLRFGDVDVSKQAYRDGTATLPELKGRVDEVAARTDRFA